MAIFTFDQAIKKAGVKPTDVRSLGMPETITPTEDVSSRVIDALKGKTSFPASEGGITSSAIPTNIAKTFGNIPSSVAKLAAPVNPLNVDSPANIGANIAGSGKALYDIYKNRGVTGAKDILGGFADTYLKIGEGIYGGLDKAYNALLDDPKKAVADVTAEIARIGIEDPMLIPTILYGSGKLTGGKDTISRVASPVTRGADTNVANITAKVTEPIVSKAGEIADVTKSTLFGRPKPISNIEDVIKQADESMKADSITSKTGGVTTPAQILSATKEASAQPSLLQKWAGISPDIKNRIAGKQGKLKEYFDVAHARNNFDTLPTPLEYGAKNVDTAVSKMESILSETGSDIGSFRQKVGTYKAPIEGVNKIETAFNNQLSKLNLEIKGGVVKQKAGTISRVNSESEIKVLNDLLGELQIIKQSPDLQRLIDYRNLFDSKINFAKSAREASSSLDPFSRTMRSEIANVSAQIVGKSEAANLVKYSDFMDALNQLKSFTDRKAGAEFLLKQVLSERGGTPRAVIQLIKERTGIDLMDDAVMSSIATDLIGNSRQKGIFRQEITKAGLDTASLLRGDTSGAINLMFNFLKRGLVNEEKQFLKAAR